MNNSRSILSILIFPAILFSAIWLGVSIATEQTQTLAYVVGGTVLVVCLLLGSRIWMIIPLAMALNLSLSIPGRPTTLILAELLFCGFCLLLFLTRKLPLKIKFNELDFWTLLISLCVCQAYLRNPVGLNILGGDSVGGRPYALFALTFLTSLILRNLSIPVTGLKWLLRLSIIGGLANLAVMSIGYVIPQLGALVGSVRAIDLDAANQGPVQATRIGFLGKFGENLSLWISAFKSPIKACFHPVWGALILLSFASAAFSGFRNEIIGVGLVFLIAIAYRSGFRSIFLAISTLFIGISTLAIINLSFPLPLNMQRSLSFFPGTWDEWVKKDAEDSTQWRVDMWEEALFTDYWIKNKILGDGLGMTAAEYNYMQLFKIRETGGAVNTGTLSMQQEFMMVQSNYHSGPVSSVRVAGYVGLFILLGAQIRLAVHAHRQIKRAMHTEWFPLTLLIGIPIIAAPFFFVFVYGEFGKAISSFLISVAFVKILKNNLPLVDDARLGSNASR